jgi:serine/threonine protein kinase
MDSSVQQTQRKPIVLPNQPEFTRSINGRNGWSVNDLYSDLGALGKGTFGDVWKAAHKGAPAPSAGHGRGEAWHAVAIKKTAPTVLDRRGGVRIWTYDHVEQRCQEVKTLLRLQEGEPHTSCVLYLFEYFWTYNHSTGQGDLILVSELLGQELDQWRQSQTTIMESSVRQIAAVLLNALDFLSSRNVVHRDLKLQNILFRVNGDFRTLKLVDFGLAKVLEGREKANDFCGSLGYIAPEIYSSIPYRYEVDMFAFGVILFRLLSAQRPFSSANPEKLRSDTINLRYKIEGKNWEGISSDALKLVRQLLIGPEQRYTASQAANHRWFVSQEDSVLVVDYGKSSLVSPDQNGEARRADETSYSHVIALVSSTTTGRYMTHVEATRYPYFYFLLLYMYSLTLPSAPRRRKTAMCFGWRPQRTEPSACF